MMDEINAELEAIVSTTLPEVPDHDLPIPEQKVTDKKGKINKSILNPCKILLKFFKKSRTCQRKIQKDSSFSRIIKLKFQNQISTSCSFPKNKNFQSKKKIIIIINKIFNIYKLHL